MDVKCFFSGTSGTIGERGDRSHPTGSSLLLRTGVFVIRSLCRLLAFGTALVALCSELPAGAATGGLAATDSLLLARQMAERREYCVEAFALAARQLDLRPDNTAATADVFRTLAVVAHHGGDTGTTLIFSQAALNLARSLPAAESPALAPFLLTQALAVRLSGRPQARATARELVTEGLTTAQVATPADPRVLADLQQAEANLVRAAGDYPRAVRLYTEALATRLQANQRHELDVVDNECWRAVTALFAGDPDTAGEELRHCQEDLRELGLPRHPLAATIQSNLALVAQAQGDRAGALALYTQAAATLAEAQNRIFPGFSRRRLTSPLYSAIADLELHDGDPEAAWLAFVAGHRIFGAQAQALARARQQDPQFAARVRDRATRAVHLLGAAEAALDTLGLSPADGAARQRAVKVLARYGQRMAQSLLLKARLRAEFGGAPAAAPGVATIQRQLAPDQVLVGYFTANHDAPQRLPGWTRVTHAVVLGQVGPPLWVELPAPSSPGLWPAYAKLVAKASEWPTRLPDDPRLATLRHELYQAWFAPLEAALAGKQEILLMAGELQAGFPFPALIDDTGRELVDRFAFRHLLDVASLTAERRTPAGPEVPSLVLGDPQYDVTATSPTAVNPTLAEALTTYANTVLSRSQVNGVLAEGAAGLATLPPLQSSGWEARAIAGMTATVTLLTGHGASEQNLNLACRCTRTHRFRWIHLATHALMHNAMPERSALALSPRDGEGLLYVEEIGFGWSLDCDLVTLSGCQTGTGPASQSSGPLGFIQALHAAGARNLLFSTGKVDDIATALLMERFYANISGRSSPRVQPAVATPPSYSFALAEAQRWLRDLTGAAGRRPFAHPVYWSNFRLIGGGG